MNVCLALSLALTAGCAEERRSEPGPVQQQPGPSSGTPGTAATASEQGARAAPRDGERFPFVDVAEHTGLAMKLTTGASPARQIVEVKGGGVALIDRDNDGDWDVFVPNGATLESPEAGPGCRLFDNLSGERGGELAFADVTAAAGLTFDRWGVGVAVGDVDGDGFDDLYITAFGENGLLVNDGAGAFVDRTDVAGVGDRRWGTGCAFGDLDLDGDLDLYVVNYLHFDVSSPPPGDTFRGVPVFGGPAGLPAQADVLYANRGDGTFADVTALSGCAAVPAAHGLNVVILDLDRDGRQEILVGNDSMPNRLLDDGTATSGESAEAAGQGGGLEPASALSGAGPWTRTFADRGLTSGISSNAEGHSQATMGFALGDVDGNGLPDVYSTNFSSDSNTLHLNADGSFFDDRTARFGLGSPSRMSVGWAASFQDFDLDGDEDLLVFNGHVYSQATESTMDSPARQRPLLFERGTDRFTVVEPWPESWLAQAFVDRSAAFGDLDGDGDADVVVGERDGPLRLLRNDRNAAASPAKASWLAVRLEDRRTGSANHRGLGAEVTLLWEGGQARRWIVSGGSYLSASEPVARFGLSEQARGHTLQVEVRWPDGFVQRLDGVGRGELLVQRP